jgi:pimeloyl-ACP methyl ester carboxylesterase
MTTQKYFFCQKFKQLFEFYNFELMEIELNYHPSSKKISEFPILFVHGMAHAAWCWEKFFVPYFNEQGYDCYSMSLRAHGRSESYKNIRFYKIAEYVEDVQHALKTIGGEVILVCHSMGGFIAQKLVLLNVPIKAIVSLASVPANGMMNGSLKIAKEMPWRFIKGNLILSTSPFSDDATVTKKLVFTEDISDEILNYTADRLQEESYFAYLDMLFLALHKPKKTTIPMLFLHAEHDFIVNQNHLEKTASGFGADFKIVKDIAHDMMLDTNWKIAADETKNFLHKISRP